MKVIISTAVTSFSVIVISSELYVGHLQSKFVQLYHEVNSAFVRISRSRMLFKTRFHFQSVIKELGSQQRDGQYVVGLTFASNGTWTTKHAVEMTLSISTLTLILMTNIYYNKF